MHRIALFLLLQVSIHCAIHVQPVSDTIAIKVSTFEVTDISDQTLASLHKFNITSAPKVIIDLRDNSGGYIYEGISFAALFVEAESLITLIEQNGAPLIITRPLNHPYIPTTELAIIINHQTASAAEAAAHILNKHPNAIIIGEPSYGKLNMSPDNPSPYKSIQLPEPNILPHIVTPIPTNLPFDTAILRALAAINQQQ